MHPKKPEGEFPLTEDQEESIEMIQQAVFESCDSGVPEEVIVVALLKLAAEFSVDIGIHRQEFLDGAYILYSKVKDAMIIENASKLPPVDE